MKILFLGTPDFAVKPLIEILSLGSPFEVIGVVTNKDKPVGRKKVLTPPPVKVEALKNNLPVFQYDKIRLEGVEDLKKLNPDIIVTCAFGQILSQEILNIPKYGVINIHASLLPKYRGASPIQHAILNGEKETGVTIMQTVMEVDAGDILLQEKLQILDNETSGELFERLSVLGSEMVKKALVLIKNGNAKYTAQDKDKATFTKMIKKEHALINWENTSEEIFNKIRAFNPSPICFTFYNGQPLKIYSAKLSNGSGTPGEIKTCEKYLEVACGKGSIIVEKVQKAGSSAMNIADFLRGNKLQKGGHFTNA